MSQRRTARWGFATCVVALTALGCGKNLDMAGEKTPAAARVETRTTQPADWSLVPVPPADGPKLAAVSMVVPVYPKPEKKDAIGYLRLGARVARSPEAVSRLDCPEGWYAVRPLGFVCAGPDATLNLEHPVARAIEVEPDRAKPMPYAYAFLRAIAPNYLRVPTTAEQFRYEMRLERHLRNWRKLRAEWDRLHVGANDVPLDGEGFAIGAIPEHARPLDESQRYGGNGQDAVPWWLVGERRIPNLSSFRAPPYAVIANRIKRHAGVALIGTFVAGEEAGRRRFAISTDARLIPADKLKADSGSPFHGYDIRQTGLPVAFVRVPHAHAWSLSGGRAERLDKLQLREFVPLTGEVKRHGGTRFVEARDGRWLRSDDLKTLAKPSRLPPWAKKGTKWIDISILSQSMVLWEGDRPSYATLVSTGRDGLGEPGKTLSTPQGTFRIYQKHVTTTMDSDVADQEFELRDVPWVMYFKGGYALHGAYWHDDFGRERSHGCVNLSPIDARYTFQWVTPQVPEHWHAAYAEDAFEQGTLVHIHP